MNVIRIKSIRQSRGVLPDFRSLGVVARILLAANAAGVIAGTLRSRTLAEVPEQFARVAVTLEPALLATLLALYLLYRPLARLPYAAGVSIAAALAAGFSALAATLAGGLEQGPGLAEALWSACYALMLCFVLAGYFNLRARAFSPALAEARLQALQARIRPHFLFNCLNAVLVLVRRDARRAEAALEDLADLFRNLLGDNRELVTFADEIALTRQYLELERLRLGERLVVEWSIDEASKGALVPPMLLQPLAENAVYHGIEPGLEPGTIGIRAECRDGRLRLVLSNPYHAEHQHRQGNRMALANIEERLALHFDVEASLDTEISAGQFRILIELPLRTER